jgi:IS5 family transposase
MTGGRNMRDALVEGQTLLADRAYDSDELRRSLDERGASANIKPLPNRKNVPAFSSYLPIQKSGRAPFNKINHYRAVARDTTKRPKTSLPVSTSLHFESGCALMRRSPRLHVSD